MRCVLSSGLSDVETFSMLAMSNTSPALSHGNTCVSLRLTEELTGCGSDYGRDVFAIYRKRKSSEPSPGLAS